MDTLSPLLQVGAIGAVLAWMLVKTDARIERVERALDRLTRAQLLTLVSRNDVDEHVKQQAGEMLKDLQANARKRGEDS